VGYQLRPLNEKLQVESTIHHFKRRNRDEEVIRAGEMPPEPPGRVPRISRMMALAIHFDQLIREGKVRDYAELARLGQVMRARVTQIMNFLSLSPTIQEQLLFLENSGAQEAIRERYIRTEAAKICWRQQRATWLA
jgi:hypothetical protein